MTLDEEIKAKLAEPGHPDVLVPSDRSPRRLQPPPAEAYGSTCEPRIEGVHTDPDTGRLRSNHES